MRPSSTASRRYSKRRLRGSARGVTTSRRHLPLTTLGPMTAPTVRLTDAGNALVAAIGKPMDSPEVTTILSAIQGWIGQPLQRVDDGHASWRSVEGGVELRDEKGHLTGVFLQIAPIDRLRRFEHVGKLIHGVSAEQSKDENRAVLGHPPISEYNLDKYLVGDGHLLYFAYLPHLAYLGIAAIDDAERRRLERAAKKAATPGPPSHRISDEDGILALVDASTWRTTLGGWDFDSLTRRFVEEMNAQRGVVWRTGSDAFGEWSVELRDRASRKKAIRESTHTIEVTSGKLSLVSYGLLTTAADDPGISLAAEAADQSFAVDPGSYRVLLRQLKNNAFELVLSPDPPTTEDPVNEPFWWFTQ